MASTYAHYRFGQQVLAGLPAQIQCLIRSNIDFYNLGLHGPDVLFYHHALTPNPVSEQGFALHHLSGYEFFQSAASVVKHFSNSADRRAALAYVYGFLCHFALDSSVHAYVNAFEAESGVAHVGIETEFDRMLLVLDGKNPLRTRLTNHIYCSERIAEICRHFYPGITRTQMKDAIRGMKRVDHLVCAPNLLKRGALYAAMKLLHRYDQLHWHFVTYRPNAACRESNQHLMALYKQALPIAQSLITNFRDFAREERINPHYRFDFEGEEKEIWERISD